MTVLDDFQVLEEAIDTQRLGDRTRSVALLAWFLESVWRLDPADVPDSICDSGGDKGIDGIVVDDDANEITVLQAKCVDSGRKQQGENDLKVLIGTSAYFTSPEALDGLLKSRPSRGLRALLERLAIRKCLADRQHSLRLVFVTNAEPASSAREYLGSVRDRLDFWGRSRCASVAHRARAPGLRPETVTVGAADHLTRTLPSGEHIALAIVRASDLVALPGIEDLSLFHLNVRLGLGRTRINRDIAATVESAEEHALFPAYHNGLTLLTSRIDNDGDRLVLHGVSVVNGCQSLLALRDAKTKLTDALALVVKIVEVGAEGSLADKITFRSNNQNPVNMRDQRATDRIQRDLQAQVRAAYSGQFDYVVRRGEVPTSEEYVDNDRVAQLIMAIWRKDPANAVHRTRLFDEDYHRVFAKDIDAHRIRLAFLVDRAVEDARDKLDVPLRGSFSSIRFTLCYLVAQALRETREGGVFIDRPGDLLDKAERKIRRELARFATDIATSVSIYIRSREAEVSKDDPETIFDPKVAFKSQTEVKAMENDVIRAVRRDMAKDPKYGFRLKPVVARGAVPTGKGTRSGGTGSRA